MELNLVGVTRGVGGRKRGVPCKARIAKATNSANKTISVSQYRPLPWRIIAFSRSSVPKKRRLVVVPFPAATHGLVKGGYIS